MQRPPFSNSYATGLLASATIRNQTGSGARVEACVHADKIVMPDHALTKTSPALSRSAELVIDRQRSIRSRV